VSGLGAPLSQPGRSPTSRSSGAARVQIRPYRDEDANATLAVFHAAVTGTAAADYTDAQIAAWSRPGQRNAADWNRRRTERDSFVAVLSGQEEIVGFTDVDADGYIDMLYTSPRYSRRGVARSLLSAAETHARRLGADHLWANVSITARPFFERHGFSVQAEQHPVLGGVWMTNFRMTKPITTSG